MGTSEQPALAVALAEATPGVVFDVLVLGFALFLVSRVWILAAPSLGRRLARGALRIGLPVLFLASLGGHVLAPQTVPELSRAMGYTAIALSLPLALLWLGSLTASAVRHLLRRAARSPPPEPPQGAQWLRIVLATVPVLGLVALLQWYSCREEVKAVDRRAEALRKIIHALEVTENRAAEFARERGLLAEKIEILHRIVPRSEAADAFSARFKEVAGEHGLQVQEWSVVRGETGVVLQEHVVTLTLRGDVLRLRELAERIQKLARLVTWREALVREQQAEVRLSIYSAPERHAAPLRDLCERRRSEVWLWPYTARLEVARAEVNRLCGERSGHELIGAQVDEFTSQKGRLEELVGAIEKLRSQRTDPVIEAAPDPALRSGPTPRKKA